MITPERLAEIEYLHNDRVGGLPHASRPHGGCDICDLLTALREVQEEITGNEERRHKMRRSEHECPQCGQDMRLPPNAYMIILKLRQHLKEVLEKLRGEEAG